MIAEDDTRDGPRRPPRRVRARAARVDRRDRGSIGVGRARGLILAVAADARSISRTERFASVGSTNDVVRAWLEAGTPEVCLAVADEQTAGRGREGRTWTAPPGAGAALLARLPPDLARPGPRLAAGRDRRAGDGRRGRGGRRAADRLDPPEVAQRPRGRDPAAGDVRKLAGVLGETDRASGRTTRARVVGIGLNADWAPADFPPELAPTMTSLREASGGRPVDSRAPARRLPRPGSRPASRPSAAGRFDVADWIERQLTNGRPVRLDAPDGTWAVVRALGVDVAERRRSSSRIRRRRAASDRPGRRDRPPARLARRRSRARPTARRAGRGVTRWPVRCSGR